MVTPMSLLTRVTRAPRLTPSIGRCPVCHGEIRHAHEALELRGGIHVHRTCATYRIRQRARAL
jgi:uncharacterized protein with PIN domain